MQKEVGLVELLERRPKGPRQIARQIANEAHRVGDDDLPLARKPQPAGGRVECGEQLVLGQDVAPGQGVEQRRLAGVGVADDGHHRQAAPHPLGPSARPLPTEAIDLLLEAVNPLARAAAVLFELGLARTAATDAAGEAAHHGVLLVQTRQPVAKLSQLDLQLAVAALGPLGEDVEDQHRPVDHLEVGEVGDGVGLHRRQIRIEDEDVGVELHVADQHLLQLAAADLVFGIGLGPALLEHAHHPYPGGPAELAQLGDPSARIARLDAGGAPPARRPAEVDDHQEGPVPGVGDDRGRGHPLELLFERADERAGVELAFVEGLARKDAPGRLSLDWRQEVGDVKIDRAPLGRHANGRDQIEPQKGEIDQVVSGQRLVAQVGVDEAQAPKAPAAGPDAADLRQVYPRGVADEDVLDGPAAADEDAHLPLDLARHATEERGQLGRGDLLWLQPAPVHPLERVLLAGLEPGNIPRDDVQAHEVSTCACSGSSPGDPRTG